jgi:2-C-methyl-D-erythritol 2,4-cyclodiphosphate synthase
VEAEPGPVIRVGQGFDVHRYCDGRGLVLCGIELPEGPGLEGHSDADVALHAVCDGLLGAVAAGDLGEHFPDTEERWCRADSRRLLRRVLEIVDRAGFRPVNCDLTIIGEHPRIAPHRGELRRSLAELLGVARSRVSVKATTTDGLGFTGRSEGLAAMAVVLLEKVAQDD